MKDCKNATGSTGACMPPGITAGRLWAARSRKGTINDAERPLDFASPVSEMGDPVGAQFVHNTKTSSFIPPVPYHNIEIDLWGPLDVGDRTGNRFAFAAIDRAAGHL